MLNCLLPPSAMKIYHLFFLTLFLKAVVGPDPPGGQLDCQYRFDGFCYPNDLPCPDCFVSYGYCEFNFHCCAKEIWRPECEYATSPAESFFPETTTPQIIYDETEAPK